MKIIINCSSVSKVPSFRDSNSVGQHVVVIHKESLKKYSSWHMPHSDEWTSCYLAYTTIQCLAFQGARCYAQNFRCEWRDTTWRPQLALGGVYKYLCIQSFVFSCPCYILEICCTNWMLHSVVLGFQRSDQEGLPNDSCFVLVFNNFDIFFFAKFS